MDQAAWEQLFTRASIGAIAYAKDAVVRACPLASSGGEVAGGLGQRLAQWRQEVSACRDRRRCRDRRWCRASRGRPEAVTRVVGLARGGARRGALDKGRGLRCGWDYGCAAA